MKERTQCECTDQGCPPHGGEKYCTNHASSLLRRLDGLDDHDGTWFCRDCADDARASGVYDY